MPVNSLLWVLSSCGLAALGQVFLKSGAAGAVAPADYVNGREYVAKLYSEAKRRPRYFIEEQL